MPKDKLRLRLFHKDNEKYTEGRFFADVSLQYDDYEQPTGKFLVFFECEGHLTYDTEEEAKERCKEMIERFKKL